MIVAAAALLLSTGIMLVALSVRGLKKPQPHTFTTPACNAPSPDSSLHCQLQIGHLGWHDHTGTSWFGETWNVDHWADTEEWPVINTQLVDLGPDDQPDTLEAPPIEEELRPLTQIEDFVFTKIFGKEGPLRDRVDKMGIRFSELI